MSIELDREEIARDMQEVLEHFHFMLGRHRMIRELHDRLGSFREVNETRDLLNSTHLVPKFLRHIASEGIRAAFTTQIAEIHAAAAHVRHIDRNNKDAHGNHLRVVEKEVSHECKAVRDACREHGIEPFAFPSLEGDAAARNETPSRRKGSEVRDDRRDFARAITAG